jgi:hypothetical protein
MQFSSVADPEPGSGAFLNPGSGMEKIRIREGKKSASGMGKNPHPGWEKIRIRDGKKFASGIRVEHI